MVPCYYNTCCLTSRVELTYILPRIPYFNGFFVLLSSSFLMAMGVEDNKKYSYIYCRKYIHVVFLCQVCSFKSLARTVSKRLQL